jgi:fructose-1,6-bisphosphatase I
MRIPKRGNIYSCNEANSEGWDESFKQYLRNLKAGKGQTGQRYTQRYVLLLTRPYTEKLTHTYTTFQVHRIDGWRCKFLDTASTI